MAVAVGKHLFAALLAEGIEALAAELQQRVALAIAQLVAADQAVAAIAIGGDAVEGEPGPPCASQDPPGHVLRRGRAAAGEQLHEHQRLEDGAHAHPLGDVRAEALVGGGGGRGHGGILAGV
ncbi:hypothetical protein [Synechococcus sp. CCY 0621]|uniref:hypothetical protein n=1 Tax=Synechococcus sp. CCY 0621 TaxID=2815603 RepID=UPI001C216F31|nr:hypothetical protein [Synechococcus sp. CCY 0621]